MSKAKTIIEKRFRTLGLFLLDIDDNWYVYSAEEVCRLAGYYVKRLEDSGSVVLQGFVDVVAICREELGITEGIPETL